MLTTFSLILAPVLLLIGALFIWKRWMARDDRRDPINIKVLHGAGQGIRSRLQEHSESFDSALVMAMLVGPVGYAAWATRWMIDSGFRWEGFRPGLFDYAMLAFLAIGVIASFRHLTKHAKAARQLRQGLAAELAVAQCLNQVMAEGGYVFHDFPCDGFNIDHIVIGQSAVFAVETKSRLKPARSGKDAARVSYDGSRLSFPDHTEAKPLEQAKRQAEWLQKFLYSGVGDPVRVIPYLALPGWFVVNQVPRPDVLVGNPKNPMFMVRDGFGPALSEAMKRRIAHVLSERYPTQIG